MWIKPCQYLPLLLTLPAFPQAVSPLSPIPTQYQDQMAIPPPVSGLAYPALVGAENQPNLLQGGMTFTAGYIDNLYPGYGVKPLAETTFSILPTFHLEQTTPLRHFSISYTPGFTFYQPTSELNEVDQSAILAYQVRLTPHSSFRINDDFRYSSISFGSTALGFGGTVSASAQPMTPGIIVPFAKQLTNEVDGQFVLQFSRNSMVGASGMATTLHYPDPSEVPGLYDSSSQGGSGFYSHRISGSQYIGAIYNFAQVFAYPSVVQSETRLQSPLAFYTIYPSKSLSLSALAGPQRYEVAASPLPATSSWAPLLSASVGWQSLHTSFAAGYSQAVTGGYGFAGAFHSKDANANTRWQVSRSWTLGADANYAINKTVNSLIFGDSLNGHTISGSATAARSISQRLSLILEYNRLHESYAGIAAIAGNPDSDRATVSLSWQIARPLGQ